MFKGQNLLDMEPEERSLAGLFMSFQSPVEIPGVSNMDFLNMAFNARKRKLGEPELDPIQVTFCTRGFGFSLHCFLLVVVCHCAKWSSLQKLSICISSVLVLTNITWLMQFYSHLVSKLEVVNMKTDFLNRNVNEGFSGGERKRNEILQLAVLLLFPLFFSGHKHHI